MELFRLVGRIAVDNTESNRNIENTTRQARNAESETSKALKTVGATAGKIASGIGLAGAAIGGAFIATVESTREYRTEMGNWIQHSKQLVIPLKLRKIPIVN